MQRVSQVQPVLRSYYYTQFLQLQEMREQIRMQVTKLTNAVRDESLNIARLSRSLRDMEVNYAHRQKRLDDEIEQSIRDNAKRLDVMGTSGLELEISHENMHQPANVMRDFIRQANKLSIQTNVLGLNGLSR